MSRLSTSDLVADLRVRLDGAAGDPGRRRPIGLDRVHVGHDALDRLPAEVDGVAGPGPVVVLTDATPMTRAGDDLKARVISMLGDGGHTVHHVVLGPPDGALHADPDALDAARDAVDGAGCVVSVGSGTVTDVAKHACHAVDGAPPLVAVQTAVSVNGFSDDMAVVLVDGVKRTVDASWVTVLVIDTAVLRDAPPELNHSGVGELMAMFTAPADWCLAGAVGLDGTYDPAIVDLFRRDGDRLLGAAAQVGRADADALGALAEMMTASGVALGVAGRTAPISGMEHIVSHMLDMSASAAGTAVGLHGAQVGVAAVVSAYLWERVLDTVEPGDLLADDSFPGTDVMRRRVLAVFAEVDPSGAMGGECWTKYLAKLSAWHAARPRLAALARRWDEVVAQLRTLVAAPAAIATALRAAGAPARFDELAPPVDAGRAHWAVANCHLMRDRFTVADLAFFTGRWSPDDAADAIASAAALADADA